MTEPTVPAPSDEGRRKLTTRPSAVEKVARTFHAEYERLAPRFAYTTRKASAVPWEDVPENNQALMMAVVQSLRDSGVIAIDVPCIRAEERAATLREVERLRGALAQIEGLTGAVDGPAIHGEATFGRNEVRAIARAALAHFNPEAES